MFRLTKLYAPKAIPCFPKMSSSNWSTEGNWSRPKVDALSWSVTPYPTNMTTTPLPSRSTPSHTLISPSTNTSRIESYDQWFERRLNDKTDDMFLL